MDFKTESGVIILPEGSDFDIAATLECGQLFRYTEKNGEWEVIAEDKRAVLKKEGGNTLIIQNDEKFFVNYFDLCRNYDIIRLKLGDKGLIGAASAFGRGIKILNQNPVECIFSFIISANNHIPRIKGIISRLSEGLGRDCGGYHAFPTAEAMASVPESYYYGLGAGYRAPYLLKTARAIAEGRFDVEALSHMTTEDARRSLTTLCGVGRKVADCILLFGLHRTDSFPVDTWIEKVYEDMYGERIPPEAMSKRLVAEYGELSGYAQQYLFYYKRTNKK